MQSKKRIYTTVIRLKDKKGRVLPVRTNKPIELELFIDCSKALSRIHGNIPIKAGDIICSNILNTGADIISCKTIND